MSRRTPSLARRAFPALALTAVGVGLVQGLDRPNTLGAVGGLDSNTAATQGTNAPVTGNSSGSTSSAQSPAGNATSQGSSGNVNSPVASAQTAPAQTSPPATAAPVTAAPTGSGTCGEVAGVGSEKAITWNRTYGVISVTAKFTSNGDLCDASASWQAYDSKSQRYEEYAVPILNKQAEAVDSANVQGVSGATAITNAYRSSLQSAIDNRH